MMLQDAHPESVFACQPQRFDFEALGAIVCRRGESVIEDTLYRPPHFGVHFFHHTYLDAASSGFDIVKNTLKFSTEPRTGKIGRTAFAPSKKP